MVDYGDWPSDWSAERAVAAGRDFSELKAAHGGLAWGNSIRPARARACTCGATACWRSPPRRTARCAAGSTSGGACCVTLDGLAWVDETDQQVRRWRAGRAARWAAGRSVATATSPTSMPGMPCWRWRRAMGRPGSCIASCAWTPMARAGCWSRAPISTPRRVPPARGGGWPGSNGTVRTSPGPRPAWAWRRMGVRAAWPEPEAASRSSNHASIPPAAFTG